MNSLHLEQIYKETGSGQGHTDQLAKIKEGND